MVQESILVQDQRDFLTGGDVRNTNQARKARMHIRNRVRQGLRDFRILAEELEARDRRQIFNHPLPYTAEYSLSDYSPEEYETNREVYQELQGDVQAAVSFLYAGLGGERGFRTPLVEGVRHGEVELGHVDNHLGVEPRFTVDFRSHVDTGEAVEAVQAGEWDSLSAASLLSFVRLAVRAGAIDWDRVENALAYSTPPTTEE